jgi:hypothetical protein
MSKVLIISGIILVVAGVILHYNSNIFSWMGKLPGDIIIKKENFQFYFPLTTSIVISVLLSLIFFIVKKL